MTSFGIVCFQQSDDKIKYLMIQRKDSLCYVEFIRGKYALENRQYIFTLFVGMTDRERQSIRDAKSFDLLWDAFWQNDNKRHFMAEFQNSKNKFDALRAGYRNSDTSEQSQPLTLLSVLDSTQSGLLEPEWGFPKGRRNINESDINCALREFEEETGIGRRDITVLSPAFQPYEETFVGCNKVRYRHIYFVACISSHCDDVITDFNSHEVSNVDWFDACDVLNHISNFNVERKDMFRKLHADVRAFCGV